MGRTVGAHQAGAVKRKHHRQVLDRHIVDQLVVGALQERRVDRDDRLQPFARQPGRERDRVLLGDAVTFAAGLACEGLKPVLAIYSTFLQRGYDQLIHDVAIQNLPITFALDRAGLVGADGATHAGAYDIAYLRCIPNLGLIAPADENECRMALTTAHRRDHPVAVRYPRGAGAGVEVQRTLDELPWGRGEVRRKGERIAILAFGTLLYPALVAAERLNATVANMRFIKPLDAELVAELARTHESIVTLEEGCVMGGAGSAVMEALHAAGIAVPVLALGLPDQFIEHGDPAKLAAMNGLDADGIATSIAARFGARPALVRVKS